MSTPPPFSFASPAPTAAPAPAADVVSVASPAPAATPVPLVGTLVSWNEYDVYDELQPQRLRYGVVVAYDEHGAAQVLALGEHRHAAHFGPTPADPSQPHGPVVADLTVVR